MEQLGCRGALKLKLKQTVIAAASHPLLVGIVQRRSDSHMKQELAPWEQDNDDDHDHDDDDSSLFANLNGLRDNKPTSPRAYQLNSLQASEPSSIQAAPSFVSTRSPILLGFRFPHSISSSDCTMASGGPRKKCAIS